MQVFSRRRNESLVIGNCITVTVVEIRGDKVRLGIECPLDVPISKKEVFDTIHRPEMARPLKECNTIRN
jgi:carbon storage regulator